MNSKSSSKPPSSDGLARPASLRKPSGRGPGKPRGGAGGALMQVAEPDAVEVHSPAVCHGCAGDLASAEVVSIERRQVFDLPEIRLRVTTPHRAPLLRVRADHRRDPVRRPRGPGPVRTAAEEPGRLPAHPSAPALPAVRRTAGRPPGRRGRHRDPAELGRAGRRRGRPAHRGRTPTAHRVRRGRLRRDRHTHRRPHLLGPRRLHPLADAGPGPPQARRAGVRGSCSCSGGSDSVEVRRRACIAPTAICSRAAGDVRGPHIHVVRRQNPHAYDQDIDERYEPAAAICSWSTSSGSLWGHRCRPMRSMRCSRSWGDEPAWSGRSLRTCCGMPWPVMPPTRARARTSCRPS